MLARARRQRMRALLVLPLLAGCRTGAEWMPAEPAAFDQLPVERTGRLGNTTELWFGHFTADSVKVSWARGSGSGVQVGGVGGGGTESRQEYRFSLRPADDARISVACHSSARERNVGLRGIEMQTSAHFTYDCDIRPAIGSAWQMSVVEQGDEGFTGALTGPATRLTLHTHLVGNRVTGRSAAAWELRDEAGVVGSVDPRAEVVWLSQRALPAETRNAVAAAAVALLIYQRPTP